MGKLIVIEGTDGSGKSTQFARLCQRAEQEGHPFQRLVFPQYQEPSSALIRMYLGGEFGEKPGDVNPYAASAFYAVDRYASYKKVWGQWYENGGVILSDRYTTSNAVHQASKLDPQIWEEFLSWLYEFEYEKIGIPKPDMVIFLDMPTDVSQKLLSKRYSGDNEKKDIHERDVDYLEHCRKAALFTAEFSGWQIVPCAENGEPRTIEAIAEDIKNKVKTLF